MKTQKHLFSALIFLTAFALWTAAVCTLDVQSIGPQATAVGLAGLNQRFHHLTGVHPGLYVCTDWLSLIPLGFVGSFALLGLSQWIHRRSLKKVDYCLFVLGVFYLVTLAAFFFFEVFPVNYRPVLIDGHPEPSYPSSTTMLVLCVIPTAKRQLRRRIAHPAWSACITAVLTAFALFMVIGRLLSGVHWLSDILGGILLSAGLVRLYDWACAQKIHHSSL